MKKFDYNTESAKSTVKAVTARALSKALITGINNAEAEGRPLTESQMIDLTTMHVMAYYEAIVACEGIDLEATLLEIAWKIQ